MDYLNAFWVGGLICALVQILLEKTKLMPGRIMVLLVCTGAVLGALGLYRPFQEFAGAGASVPLLGFGNVLMEGVKEAVDEQGFLGLFAGGLKAGAVGNFRSPDFRISGQSGFQPENEKMRGANRRLAVSTPYRRSVYWSGTGAWPCPSRHPASYPKRRSETPFR